MISLVNKQSNITKQFIAFSGVGVIGTAAHFIILVILVEFLKLTPVIASSCGAVIGALVNYRLNYKFTFNSQKSHKKTIAKFFIVAVIGFSINFVILWFLTIVITINYMTAQVIATVIVLAWSFSINKIWTF